jgi:hypothetical protein
MDVPEEVLETINAEIERIGLTPLPDHLADSEIDEDDYDWSAAGWDDDGE